MATTAKKYKHIDFELKAYIVEAIHDVLKDPDFGLELTEQAKRRLRAAKNKTQKYYSHAEVLKRFG